MLSSSIGQNAQTNFECFLKPKQKDGKPNCVTRVKPCSTSRKSTRMTTLASAQKFTQNSGARSVGLLSMNAKQQCKYDSRLSYKTRVAEHPSRLLPPPSAIPASHGPTAPMASAPIDSAWAWARGRWHLRAPRRDKYGMPWLNLSAPPAASARERVESCIAFLDERWGCFAASPRSPSQRDIDTRESGQKGEDSCHRRRAPRAP